MWGLPTQCGSAGEGRSHPPVSGYQAALISGTDAVLMMNIIVTMAAVWLTNCNRIGVE
jgi:hypothetical protein